MVIRRKWKKFLSFCLVLAMVFSLIPQTAQKVNAAEASADISNLGQLGTLTIGNKTKNGNWYKLSVNGANAFCMNLGHTCHSGDVYQSADTVYKNTDGGKKRLKAYIGYWFDITMKQKKQAYVLAQALFWSVQEDVTEESRLKEIIRTIKDNTGYFSNKTTDDLYNDIFAVGGNFEVKVTEWTYAGSGSHRQKLLEVKATSTSVPQYKLLNSKVKYRQRINIIKKDEDGNPLSDVAFTLTAENLDEMVSFQYFGKNAVEDGAVQDDQDQFEVTAVTAADGTIHYRFTYQLLSEDYGYVPDAELNQMNDATKQAVRDELEADGYRYAKDLTKSGANALAEKDLELQFLKISNSYLIRETDTGNDKIVADPEYAAGKRITVTAKNSWKQNKDGTWAEVADGTLSEYPLSYSLNIQNNYKKISLIVKKKDGYSEDGKAHGNASLDGAKFQLYEDGACTVPASVVDKNGEKVTAGVYTIKGEKLTTDFLRSGKTYYLKEIQSPIGYISDQQVIPVTADTNPEAVEYTWEGQSVTVYNQPITGQFTICKVKSNGTTGEGDWETGSQFQVYLKEKGSYEDCDEYERDTITIGIDGKATTKRLYYGEYVIHQISTGGADTEMIADTVKVIDGRQEEPVQVYIDYPFQSYLRIIKKSGSTEKTVLKEGTAYQIYQVDEQTGKESLITQSHSNGNQIIQTDTFQTDESGQVMTWKPLPSGLYRIYEISAANGFHITKKYIEVEINSKADNYTQESDAEGNTYTTVSLDYTNEETYGKLSVKKTGEQLADFVWREKDEKDLSDLPEILDSLSKDRSRFVYEKTRLKGVVFEVYAAEDIFTQDNQGTTWYQKGDLACTITTGKGAQFTSQCGGISDYSMSSDGTVTVNLPLGKYQVKEKDTVYGYVLPEKTWDVEFAWENKEDEFVLDSSGITDQNGVLSVFNERAKAEVSILKQDSRTSKPVSGAVFGLYTKDAIYNAAGKRIVEADSLLDIVATNALGKAVSSLDLPMMSEDYKRGEENEGLNSGDYYFKELEVPKSYYLSATPAAIHLEYKDQDTKTVMAGVSKKNIQTNIEIDKLSLAGKRELPGCQLQITDNQGNVIVSWISGDRDSVKLIERAENREYQNLYAQVNEVGNLVVGGLFGGEEYTLTETRPAEGYVTADDISFRIADDIEEKDFIYKKEGEDYQRMEDNIVRMYDDTTKIHISKTDLTGEKEIEGCQLEVTKKSDQTIVDSWTSTGQSHDIIGVLVVGETYILTERRPADGYVTAESIEFTITDTGEVQLVRMKDGVTKIAFSKVDKQTGKGLAGAKIEVLDSNGKKVAAFTSKAKKATLLKGIFKVGETYTFVEKKAPENYEKAEDIQFKVKDTSKTQKVKMQDQYKPKKPGKIITDVPEGFPGGSGLSPKTGYPLLIRVLAGLMLLSAALLLEMYRRKKHLPGKEKRLRAGFFLFTVLLAVSQVVPCVVAASGTKIMTQSIEYVTKDAKEKAEDQFQTELKEGKKKYVLENISYEIVSSEPVMKEVPVTKTLKSEVVRKGFAYTPREKLTVNGITYQLKETKKQDVILKKGYSQIVTGWQEYGTLANARDAPSYKEVAATDKKTGKRISLFCKKKKITRRKAKKWQNVSVNIRFISYDADVFQWKGFNVQKNEKHPLKGYEQELLESVAGDATGYRLKKIAWNGKTYRNQKGILCRDASAVIQKKAERYRVTYQGTRKVKAKKGTKYISLYEGKKKIATGENTYTICAKALYQQKEEKVPALGITIGILFAIVLVIGVVFILRQSKSKKQV
ncbi:MAG: hypothetical protein J5979_07450 [Lachnospiraceae bacterium]|nr:hypothetical protein [Lachnospiraceae bacterium]